jgi:hypothetical protein
MESGLFVQTAQTAARMAAQTAAGIQNIKLFSGRRLDFL